MVEPLCGLAVPKCRKTKEAYAGGIGRSTRDWILRRIQTAHQEIDARDL